MRGHFRYLRFKTFPMTLRKPQCEVFWALLSSSEHSGVPEDSKSPTFPSVGLHPHTWPKWGCNRCLWELAKANLEKAHKRYKNFADKSRREVKFQEGDEMWLNIKNFRLPKGLSHKFLGPYAGPFKVLEKKLSDTYKLELPKNLRVHPTFHVSLLKPVACDASRPN